MLTSNDQPLAIASKLLTPMTLEHVRCQPFHARGWRILDRWAQQSPESLRCLEGKGLVVLLNRLLDQQVIEHAAVMAAMVAGSSHLSEGEIFELAGVATELVAEADQ
ncbi:hypothetical protein [Dyella sp.]|uniref:hypothetical protein n=1 Tax=Dyella sp. TaxID=1869338 RepID=UPI002ED6752F